MSKFPFYHQADLMDCGAACLRMIAKHFGKSLSITFLRDLTQTTREGASLLSISDAAESLGFRTLGMKISPENVNEKLSFPCIAHWNQSHFIVIYKITKNKIFVADPSHGLIQYPKEEFLRGWGNGENGEGILLFLEPTKEFHDDKELSTKTDSEKAQGFSFLSSYVLRERALLTQLFIGLFAASLLQLALPFLTQSIVDIGIQNHDLSFIYLILLGQLLIFLGRTSIEIIRGWILLHVSSRISISLISDFFIKLMKLPISFYDTKMNADIMQRISDHHRIENFLTGSSLSILFSMFNLVIFGAVLAWYHISIFLIFAFGSVIYVAWILFFLKRRADLDYKRFNQNGQNHSKVYELINGMQEIKLHNAERQKRWQWEILQIKQYKINMQGLTLSQTQNSGAAVINELKNIIITFIAAKLVLDGQITLGMMLSVGYITGQLNGPITELVTFIQQWQDAKLSLLRLSEIHTKADEQANDKEFIRDIPVKPKLHLRAVSFRYLGADSDWVLDEVSMSIPPDKVTAIVGSSGSGKTTLMKMLLKFYDPIQGKILLGEADLSKVSPKSWRSQCGVVMQDGYIFSDTIANNIALGDENIDKERLTYASRIANIEDYIQQLPLGYNTKIGNEGRGLSGGQKQRILIARAVYKNPNFLFFDEATSALDANNEKTIMSNLDTFFEGKTVVVIAHRLSTVKNADQIIVMEKGKIVETGNHDSLTKTKGAYYELVKNQLELGN